MPYSFVLSARSRATPDAVFDALVRAATWPSWSSIDSVEIEGGGDPGARQGVGETRVFRTGRAVSHERVVELVAGKRFGYENVSGPFRSYRGTVELAEAPRGGTDIVWSVTFEPRLPLSGPLWRWYLARYMRPMAEGLSAYAAATPQDQ
ncbi:SRPBCC family protein [Streptomyces varsoviensis]|uniref:SRPBCC family protein n=1 Tax=Streptomyces varsoviensis TaxID=67373 RepID=UPI003406606A